MLLMPNMSVIAKVAAPYTIVQGMGAAIQSGLAHFHYFIGMTYRVITPSRTDARWHMTGRRRTSEPP